MNKENKKLIFKKKRFDYVCELTEDMDKYIKFENPTIFNTYIYNDKIDKYWLIRFPGATRGRITVDENEVITNIEIYRDENNIYKEETENILREKYIGYKIVKE